MVLKSFTNEIAYEIGTSIIGLAKKRHQSVGVLVASLNQDIFLYMMKGLSADKNHWLRRKKNSVIRYSVSTLSLYKKFSGEIPYEKYGISSEDFTATPGGVPIFVNGTMVGVVAVTGLTPEEDHQLILDVIGEMEVFNEI